MGHVEGLVKASVWREVALGEYFSDARDVATILKEKSLQNTEPRYVVQEIKNIEVETAQIETQSKKFL